MTTVMIISFDSAALVTVGLTPSRGSMKLPKYIVYNIDPGDDPELVVEVIYPHKIDDMT